MQLLTVFYRTSLNKGHEITTVQSELENIRSYLSIQPMLTDHSFSIGYHLDETLLSCRIPCYVLQPLVENAIGHGLRDSRKPEKKLEISLYRRGAVCCIEIYDSGMGIPPETMAILLQRETDHLGVKNMYERLRRRPPDLQRAAAVHARHPADPDAGGGRCTPSRLRARPCGGSARPDRLTLRFFFSFCVHNRLVSVFRIVHLLSHGAMLR